MDVCKRRLAAEGFSTIATTLGSVFRPDPVVPDAMLALLRALDMPPVYVPAPDAARQPLAP